jgi:hypothetical protein
MDFTLEQKPFMVESYFRNGTKMNVVWKYHFKDVRRKSENGSIKWRYLYLLILKVIDLYLSKINCVLNNFYFKITSASGRNFTTIFK